MTGNVPSTTLPDVSVTAPAPSQTTGSTAPYAKRIIQLTFQLASGQFGGGGGNTLTISGLRTFVTVERGSFPTAEHATIRVHGMTLDHMNSLTVAGTYYTANVINKNVVSVAAGDVGGSLSTIFKGTIIEAHPDFNNQPNVSFVIQANSSAGLAMTAIAPTSFPGTATVEQALTQVLSQAGVTVKNNGVDVTLQSPYFPGGVWQQVGRIIQAANCSAAFDGTTNTFTISPKFGSATASNPAIISPETGMIGYPEFELRKIRVRTLFTPGIIIGPQAHIQVKSQLSAANGLWHVFEVIYNISAEAPGGPWEMILTGTPVSNAPTAPAGAAGAV